MGLKDKESSEDTVYAIDQQLRIVYVNPSWCRFARENGGEPSISRDWSVGAKLFDSIASPLRPYIESTYAQCLEALRPSGFEYECSGPGTYRLYRQSIFPLDPSGLVLVNSLVEERPFREGERPPHEPDRSHYLTVDGVIVQCCHCRRVKREGTEGRWDWVPAWVERSPEETSHGLCPICLEYFYPAEEDDG